MIQKSIELLAEPFKTKVKVFLDMVRIKYPNVEPFETLRTYARQMKLFKEGKSRTMNSYHLKGKAIDLVFMSNGKPTWIGNYDYLHYVGNLCGMKPIKNSKGKIIEMCHLQDNLKSIKGVIEANSKYWHMSHDETEKDILHYVNEQFRKTLS